jgi:hypothetical protein
MAKKGGKQNMGPEKTSLVKVKGKGGKVTQGSKMISTASMMNAAGFKGKGK